MYTILIALLIGAAAGGAWTALALWKTWQFGLVLFFLISIVSFVVISRVMAKRVEPRFMDVQRMIQSGQTPLAIQTLEELMPLSNWQILLKGQIHAQIGLLAYASGDEARAEEHLPRSGYRATEAQMALAALSYRKGRKDQAYEALNTAITAAKKQIMPYHVYAWMALKDGDKDKAMDKLLAAEKVEKSNESTQENLERLRNGKKLNMKRFGMPWFGLQLEKPPAQYRAAAGQPARKGFRQRKQKKG
ncbi:MAG: tetratricopeptide repeat protein [Myxococcota bacterium]